MVCRVSAAMIGATRIVCAITIACGVNRRPQDAERAGARQQQIDREPDHHRRQAHQRVEDDDHRLAAGKAHERERGAERQADQRAQGRRPTG